MKTVKIILIAALVLAVGLSFFACRKTEPAEPGPTEQTGPEITVVNEAVKADFWILPDTEANRKTSLWGTASADDLKAGLARLKDIGLDGVEAEYQANAPEETILHLRTAYALGLAVTAGSDFHGANKPTITLGMTVADEEEFLAPFWEALAAVRR